MGSANTLYARLNAGALLAKAKQADQSTSGLAYADKLIGLVQDTSNYKCSTISHDCLGVSGMSEDATNLSPPKYCEFTLSAKRLNFYPDAMELVWYDEDAPNQDDEVNTGHALGWIVNTLKNSGLPGTAGLEKAASRLCRPPSHSARSFYKYVKHY
jgi:hypothetical protein